MKKTFESEGMKLTVKEEGEIISFLSGKGGSGKTTVAISLSYLLSHAGFEVLLIDLDIATYGASYFFKDFVYEKKVPGLFDFFDVKLDPESFSKSDYPTPITDWSPYLIPDTKSMYFVHFRKYLEEYTDIYLQDLDYANKFEIYLSKFIWSLSHDFDYILIDSQAGYVLSSITSCKLSNKCIFVLEPDEVSKEMVENLKYNLSDVLPPFKGFLFNKIDIRERGRYEGLDDIIISRKILPPLPFDFNVRNAFSKRVIPIDISEPNGYLFALVRTVKSIITERRDYEVITEYEKKIIDKGFKSYREKLDGLIETKGDIEGRLYLNTRKYARVRFVLIISIVVLIYLLIGTILMGNIIENIYTEMIFMGMSIIMAIIVMSYVIITQGITKVASKSKEEFELRNKLESINKEIDLYKSYLLTKEEDLLLDLGVKPEKDG